MKPKYIVNGDCTDFKNIGFVPLPINNFSIPQEEMVYVKKTYLANLYNDGLMYGRKRYWDNVARLHKKLEEFKSFKSTDNFELGIISGLETAIFMIENPENN